MTMRFVGRRQVLKAATAAVAFFVSSTHAGEPIWICFSMPLTGPSAPAGRMFLLGREIWRDEVNANGGLLGRPVQFVYYDDQSNPSVVPGIYEKLLDVDKVDLVISPFSTNLIAASMPLVMQHKMAYMALFGTAVNDAFKYDRYFQILPNGPEGNRSLSAGFFQVAATMTPVPRTVAILAEDTEYGQTAAAGARANVAGTDLKIVYDHAYPPTLVDHSPVVRAIKATAPDLLFVASYPAATVSIIRSVHESGFQPRMLGGPMIGAQFSQTKAKLGPLLNGLVVLDNYVPEPTMKFPGVEEFLKNYQARAAGNGVDPLGYWAPFAYASLQILGETVTRVGTIDQEKIARYIHENAFATVVGDVRFDKTGEWVKTRFLFIQYQNIQGNDIDQFRQTGKQVILYPPELKSGDLIYPFTRTE
jgi:branched-chain amino acid transport system substrate-binding protein